jgi:hypothetical protein
MLDIHVRFGQAGTVQVDLRRHGHLLEIKHDRAPEAA